METFAWSDPLLRSAVSPVLAVHLTELRQALAEVYDAAGQAAPVHFTPTITAGSTVMSATDIAELRSAIRAIW